MRTKQMHAEAFVKAVEQALEHFEDVKWLGTRSPLTAPYYLGRLLDGQLNSDSPIGRARVLQQALRQAAEQLPDDYRRLVSVSYLDRDRRLNNTGVILRLNETKPTYYRRRRESIYALAIALNKNIQPPLHPEKPAIRRMVGREKEREECLNSLYAGRSVAIIGPSGIGKTTLGINLIEIWSRSRSFWFTIRIGLNDDLSSLVFALGYFLHGLGSSHLWRQLVADEGSVELQRVLGLLRYDLAQLHLNPPLLCIDEVELLQSENGRHAPILELLRELRDVAPILLIGQQQAIEVQHPILLTGLDETEMQHLFVVLGLDEISFDSKQRLLTVVRGVPVLVEMIALLYRAGESIENVYTALGQSPSLQPLLERLWKKLSINEQNLLMLLAVLRTSAPLDVLRQAKSLWEPALSDLLAREIVYADHAGSVTLVNHMRGFVLQRVSDEISDSLHRYASSIHALSADYTEAAYHLVQAHEPVQAISLWLSHLEEEIERGRADQARVVFESVDESALPTEADKQALALLRGRQLLVAGEAESAVSVLTVTYWPSSHIALPYMEQLLGDAYRHLSQFEKAEDRYRAALDALVGSRDLRRVFVHGKLGYLYVTHMRELARARQEGLKMELATLSFRGYVEEESGNFTLARDYYYQALEIVQQLGNRLADQSRIYSDLGRLAWRQGDANVSIVFLEKAIASDQTIGEPVSALIDHLNLSAAYIIAGDYEKSLAHVQPSLPLAEAVNNSYIAAGLASNGAEACYYLGRIDDAERFAMQSLRHEETSHQPYALTVLGRVRYSQNNYQDAAAILNSAVEIAHINSDIYAEAPARLYLGEALIALNNTADAKKQLVQAAELFQKLELESEKSRAEQLIQCI